MREHYSHPGWTFCKFGTRGPVEAGLAFNIGIACAPFGAAWSRFLCTNPDIGYRTNRSLVSLTHTPSGYAVGVFDSMELAVEAAELVMRSSLDLTRLGGNEDSVPLVMRARQIWSAVGIVWAPFLAFPVIDEEVPEGMPGVGIFIKNQQFATQPKGPLS